MLEPLNSAQTRFQVCRATQLRIRAVTVHVDFKFPVTDLSGV
jgi:hypothetical protein